MGAGTVRTTLFVPLKTGLRSTTDWDGTYTLDDLPDIAEQIRVRRENEERAAEAARG